MADEKQYIIDIVNKAVKLLNEKKGTEFKLAKTTFGGYFNYDTDKLEIAATLTIENNVNKKFINLFYEKSFFDINIPSKYDDKANINKASNNETRLILRVAYAIWAHRKFLS